jgi:hypothetical protein
VVLLRTFPCRHEIMLKTFLVANAVDWQTEDTVPANCQSNQIAHQTSAINSSHWRHHPPRWSSAYVPFF